MNFAKINQDELTRLAEHKASGLAIMVFAALSLHDLRKTGVVFPSLKRIQELVPGFHIQSIYKALRWLKEKKFISVEKATSKSRFSILSRVKDRITSRTTKPPKPKKPSGYKSRSNDSHKRKTQKENNNYYKKNNSSHLTEGQQLWCAGYSKEEPHQPADPALLWLFEALERSRLGKAFINPDGALKSALLRIVEDKEHFIWSVHRRTLDKLVPRLV